mmetsp:Transcript_58153/g.162113  ORF Transcript_58153/g.162113 Transcript_58153/m.162113 type:complete len:200 (-) Transcript_58153:1195-1794(-)
MAKAPLPRTSPHSYCDNSGGKLHGSVANDFRDGSAWCQDCSGWCHSCSGCCRSCSAWCHGSSPVRKGCSAWCRGSSAFRRGCSAWCRGCSALRKGCSLWCRGSSACCRSCSAGASSFMGVGLGHSLGAAAVNILVANGVANAPDFLRMDRSDSVGAHGSFWDNLVLLTAVGSVLTDTISALSAVGSSLATNGACRGFTT